MHEVDLQVYIRPAICEPVSLKHKRIMCFKQDIFSGTGDMETDDQLDHFQSNMRFIYMWTIITSFTVILCCFRLCCYRDRKQDRRELVSL